MHIIIRWHRLGWGTLSGYKPPFLLFPLILGIKESIMFGFKTTVLPKDDMERDLSHELSFSQT